MKQEITVKNQLKLSLPMAFEQLVNVLMTTIDTLVVGLLGVDAIASVGAMGTILNLLFIMPNTITVSNNAIIANLIGERKNKEIQYTLGNSILLGVVFAVVLSIIILSISPILPAIFNVEKTCLGYLYIRLLGFIPLTITNILSGFERTNGNPNLILNIKIISLIINLVLDILVVHLGYGIIGVAFVTILIDFVTMIYLLIRNYQKAIFKIKKKIIKNICYYVKWNTVERVISKIDILIMNIIVSNIGTVQYSVHVLLSQLIDMYRDFLSGIQNGITINVGILYGAKKKELFSNLKNVVFKIQKFLSLLAPLLIFMISFVISKIYFKESLQIKTFYEILPIILINSFINVISIYYYAYLRGVKDFKFLANRNIISSIIKIVVAFILSYYFGVIGVWLSYFVYSLTQFTMSKRRYNNIKDDICT